MDTTWRALQVVANHEKRVVQHLTARSLEHYLPLYSQKSHWTDRTVVLQRPLFPGYVFVRFIQQEKSKVVSTPGVLHIVGNGSAATISCIEIEKIRAALKDGYCLQPHPKVVVGMRVRIRSGIFEGAEGLVTDLRQSRKVVLALSAVEQCFSLEVQIQDIEALTRCPDRMPNGSSSQWSHSPASVPCGGSSGTRSQVK